MAYTAELIAEAELLALFNLDTTQEGLKVHHSAAPATVAAPTGAASAPKPVSPARAGLIVARAAGHARPGSAEPPAGPVARCGFRRGDSPAAFRQADR